MRGISFGRTLVSLQIRIEGVVGVFSCSVCNNQSVLAGYNDLESQMPEVAKAWNYERNALLPSQVTVKSHRKVWWKCPQGHEWEAKVYARTQGNGCPYCSQKMSTSKAEQLVFYYIKKYFPDAVNRYDFDGVQLDVFVPSKAVGVEYDGAIWHVGDNDRKFWHCNDRGVALYVVSGNEARAGSNVYSYDEARKSALSYPSGLSVSIGKLLMEVFGVSEQFEDWGKAVEFALSRYGNINSNNLSLPEMAIQWSDRLNGYSFQYVSSDGVDKWWRCEKHGHAFKRRLDVIRGGKTGCPYCARKRSFQYWYLTEIKGKLAILDVQSMEVELVPREAAISGLLQGANIWGISFDERKEEIVSAGNPFSEVSETKFYNLFHNVTFQCVEDDSGCAAFVKELNEVFGGKGSLRNKRECLEERLR